MLGVEQRLSLPDQHGAGLPGSVPLRGFRFAIHISPGSGIDAPLDGVKFGIDAHALLANPARGGLEASGAHVGPRVAVHALQRLASVLGAGQPKGCGTLVADSEQPFREPQGDRQHNYPI